MIHVVDSNIHTKMLLTSLFYQMHTEDKTFPAQENYRMIQDLFDVAAGQASADVSNDTYVESAYKKLRVAIDSLSEKVVGESSKHYAYDSLEKLVNNAHTTLDSNVSASPIHIVQHKNDFKDLEIERLQAENAAFSHEIMGREDLKNQDFRHTLKEVRRLNGRDRPLQIDMEIDRVLRKWPEEEVTNKEE